MIQDESGQWPWRELVEHNPDIVMLAARDTTILYINRTVPPRRSEDVVGTRGIDSIVAEYRAHVLSQCARAWDTGEVIEFEVPAQAPAGTVWYYARVGALRRDGVTACLMIVVREITDRRRAEQEHLALQQSLQEARRMESLGILAGGVAHDFNNLLTGITGYANLARDRLTPQHPAHVHLEEVEKLGGRAAELCRQMLVYAGKARLVLGPLDLNRVIDESQQMLRLTIPRHVTLELRPATALPPIRGDSVPVWQAVLHLVVNAAEAIAESPGTITIGTGSASLEDAFLELHAPGRKLPAGVYVFLEVSDNGSGMTEEVQARMFEPFFTTRFTGRGLGLAAVQGIVYAHHGLITVRSAVGQGTVVRLLLPRLSEPDGETAAPATTGAL